MNSRPHPPERTAFIDVVVESPSPHPASLENAIYVAQGQDATDADFIAATFGKRMPPLKVNSDGVILGGFNSYGMSPVTSRNIVTAPVNNCLAVMVVGEDAEDSIETKQLATLSHIVVGEGPMGIEEEMIQCFHDRITELSKKTKPGTRAALFAGGSLDTSNIDYFKDSVDAYARTTEKLTELLHPLVDSGFSLQPSIGDLHRNVGLRTQTRTVHIRPHEHPRYHLPGNRFPPIIVMTHIRQNLHEILSIISEK